MGSREGKEMLCIWPNEKLNGETGINFPIDIFIGSIITIINTINYNVT